MIYIIEGIDKSGKSTVISDIRKILDTSVVVKIKNKPKNGSDDEMRKVWTCYDELFAQALANHEEVPFIFDRAYPSELVYSKINRGYDAFYNADWWKLDESLKDVARFIYCFAPEEVLTRRFAEHSETDLTQDQFKEVLDRYDMFLQKTSLKVLPLDTTKTREENISVLGSFIALK